MPNIDDVRALCKRLSNWGRWGPDDELGTLNFITPEKVTQSAGLVRKGKVISCALPYDENGPQVGTNRFNPIHLMIRTGSDAVAGTIVRDFYGGVDRHYRTTDDLIIMPLQCGTQWDALAHVSFEGKMYNGYDASWVSSRGAMRNAISVAADKVVSRGVLADLPRWQGKPWLEPGQVITGDDLQACLTAEGIAVESGDIVLVRTGRMGRMRAEGAWGDYAGGPCPGLGISVAEWLHEHEVAAIATDTWAAEVVPMETTDVWVPLHIIAIVHMGILLGEIFDLEDVAADCAEDGIYEFQFVGPPLPFTRAVGSPLNPLAIK